MENKNVPEIITQDRSAICEIISEMLDNPNECGVYETSKAYTQLEALVKSARIESVGWMMAEACVSLDKGEDLRQRNVPEIIEGAEKELVLPWAGPE